MKRRIPFVCLLVILDLTLICSFSYSRCSLRRMREATLKLDLFMIRLAVANYTYVQDRGPRSIQDLVDAHYLIQIPVDPFTRKKDWMPNITNAGFRADQAIPEITSVHSASNEVGRNGIAYNMW